MLFDGDFLPMKTLHTCVKAQQTYSLKLYGWVFTWADFIASAGWCSDIKPKLSEVQVQQYRLAWERELRANR